MSVLNIVNEPGSVRFLTDTMTYQNGRPVALSLRKAEVAPSRRFIWATRGSVGLGNVIDAAMPIADDFDTAAELAHYTVARLDAGLMAVGQTLELHVGGWSERQGEMTVVRIMRRHDGQRDTLEVAEVPRGVTLLPGSLKLPQLPQTVPNPVLVKLAVAQWQMSDRFRAMSGGGGLCIGGVMHLTTITPDGAEQSIAGVFPDYDRTASALEDPNAAEVAAFRGAGAALAA